MLRLGSEWSLSFHLWYAAAADVTTSLYAQSQLYITLLLNGFVTLNRVTVNHRHITTWTVKHLDVQITDLWSAVHYASFVCYTWVVVIFSLSCHCPWVYCIHLVRRCKVITMMDKKVKDWRCIARTNAVEGWHFGPQALFSATIGHFCTADWKRSSNATCVISFCTPFFILDNVGL